MNKMEEVSQAILPTEVIEDSVGGATPSETLFRFAEAISLNDTKVISGLAVPALRDHITTIVAGLPPAERVELVGALRNTASGTSAVSPEDQSYVVSDPVYVELVKYPSGVWKVASF